MRGFRLPRRGWVDVALATAILAAWELFFAAVVRQLPEPSLGHLAQAARIIYHLAGLTLCAVMAVRGLQRRVDVWKRLYLPAVLMMVVVGFQPWLKSGPPDPLPPLVIWVTLLGHLLVAVDVVYLLLWVPAWLVLRRRADAADAEVVPPQRRTGILIWCGLLAVGLLMIVATAGAV